MPFPYLRSETARAPPAGSGPAFASMDHHRKQRIAGRLRLRARAVDHLGKPTTPAAASPYRELVPHPALGSTWARTASALATSVETCVFGHGQGRSRDGHRVAWVRNSSGARNSGWIVWTWPRALQGSLARVLAEHVEEFGTTVFLRSPSAQHRLRYILLDAQKSISSTVDFFGQVERRRRLRPVLGPIHSAIGLIDLLHSLRVRDLVSYQSTT